jgi:coenzyme F420-reducing hydrogenase delta subunit
MAAQGNQQKILILATETCAYPGANAVETFYLDCFAKGIGGIIIMSCGEECPYEGAYHDLAARIDRVYQMMKERDLDIRRLRLTAICTVCTRAFVKEVNNMNEVLSELGPPGSEKAA